MLSGSRKLGGHSGPHPSGSCCARGGCLPKGVSGELHAHRLRHRYLPFPALIWLHCLLFLGCFLFCPRFSGGSLSKQPVLASWVGCSAPGCRARCCSCSPDSVHQGELMPHASAPVCAELMRLSVSSSSPPTRRFTEHSPHLRAVLTEALRDKRAYSLWQHCGHPLPTALALSHIPCVLEFSRRGRMPTPNPGHGAVLSGPAGSLLQQASFPFFSTLMQADSSAPLSRALPLLGV